jgi:ubiquinone/menaquinone biosynthesis C-methylase UbiE
MTHKDIADVFDTWATNGRAESMEHGHGDVVRQVLAQIPLERGQVVLDLGCGNGWATRLIARSARGVRAMGVDCSEAMIQRARELTVAEPPAGGTAHFVTAPFEALPFPDATFARVFSMEAIYYAVDLERALAEVARVLEPGGSVDLVLDCFAESPTTRGWSALVGLPMHCLPEAEWRDALGRAGLEGVRSRRVVDSRGPGDESAFVPSAHAPDWATQVGLHAAGSLWLAGRRPFG